MEYEFLLSELVPDQALAANSGSSRNILPHIAQATGGVYFHASNSEALQDIYQQIDQYEPIEADEQRRTKATELYPWPLALSMTMIAVLAFLLCNNRNRPGIVSRGEKQCKFWMSSYF